MTIGVYVILNTATGEEYVGKSANIEQRWREHGAQLRAGEGNRVLQRAWNAYGADAFAFRIVEVCASIQHIDKAEARQIAERQPVYNRTIPVASHGERRLVSMKWPVGLLEEMDAAAQERDMTKSELVIQILREWLAKG